MNLRRHIWAIATSALIAAFLIGGAVAKDGTLFGPTVASWVQAIGSVVAIVAAALVSVSLAREEARQRRVDAAEARVRALDVLTHLAFNASNAIGQGLNALPSGPTVTVGFGNEVLDLEHAREAIDRLPLAVLDVPAGAVASILELRSYVIRVHGMVAMSEIGGAFRPVVEHLVERARSINGELMILKSEAERKLCEVRGMVL